MKGFISLLFKKHKKEKEVPKIESHEKEPALQKDSQSAHPEEKRTLLKSADHQGVAAKPQKSPEETIKEEMYQYMNRGVQMMFSLYGTDRWSELSLFGEISQDLYENYEEVLQTLSKPSGKLAGDFFSCLVFSKEEGKIIGKTEDPEKMKPVFFEYMMPFYPMYFRQLKEGGLRHNSLYSVEALSLFHELTGKKFRPGYRNRYKTGVRAFEWDKDRYKVYQNDAKLLCDAVFEEGKIKSGYGQSRKTDPLHPDWEIVCEGEWIQGVLQNGITRYEYQIKVGKKLHKKA